PLQGDDAREARLLQRLRHDLPDLSPHFLRHVHACPLLKLSTGPVVPKVAGPAAVSGRRSTAGLRARSWPPAPTSRRSRPGAGTLPPGRCPPRSAPTARTPPAAAGPA